MRSERPDFGVVAREEVFYAHKKLRSQSRRPVSESRRWLRKSRQPIRLVELAEDRALQHIDQGNVDLWHEMSMSFQRCLEHSPISAAGAEHFEEATLLVVLAPRGFR